jgi:hypothetical protein
MDSRLLALALWVSAAVVIAALIACCVRILDAERRAARNGAERDLWSARFAHFASHRPECAFARHPENACGCGYVRLANDRSAPIWRAYAAMPMIEIVGGFFPQRQPRAVPPRERDESPFNGETR